ncbi:hypothetical protein N7G274_001386 [Stereocaulon virgatum]|uniref:Uncharacterized protein n=1 Tax=Stereocaulon virgatum TaxID=373712 RepID=A0ABR4APH7_9LECA
MTPQKASMLSKLTINSIAWYTLSCNCQELLFSPAESNTRIRKAYLWLARGRTVMDPGEHHHADHCFDILRQYIMYTASDTPLYFVGNATADGQPRQCRD